MRFDSEKAKLYFLNTIERQKRMNTLFDIESIKKQIRDQIDDINESIKKHIMLRKVMDLQIVEPGKLKLLTRKLYESQGKNPSLLSVENSGQSEKSIDQIVECLEFIFKDDVLLDRDAELVEHIIDRIQIAREIAKYKIKLMPNLLECSSESELETRIRFTPIPRKTDKDEDNDDKKKDHIYKEIEKWCIVPESADKLYMIFKDIIYPMSEREQIEYILLRISALAKKRE